MTVDAIIHMIILFKNKENTLIYNYMGIYELIFNTMIV